MAGLVAIIRGGCKRKKEKKEKANTEEERRRCGGPDLYPRAQLWTRSIQSQTGFHGGNPGLGTEMMLQEENEGGPLMRNRHLATAVQNFEFCLPLWFSSKGSVPLSYISTAKTDQAILWLKMRLKVLFYTHFQMFVFFACGTQEVQPCTKSPERANLAPCLQSPTKAPRPAKLWWTFHVLKETKQLSWTLYDKSPYVSLSTCSLTLSLRMDPVTSSSLRCLLNLGGMLLSGCSSWSGSLCRSGGDKTNCSINFLNNNKNKTKILMMIDWYWV